LPVENRGIYYRYANPDYSITEMPLSVDDCKLIKEAITLLGKKERTSGTFRFNTFLLWQASPSSPSEQCAALDLSAILPSSFRVQRYNRLMKPFFVAEKKYIKNSFLQKNKNKRIAIQNKIPTSC
jgi:hypothetical protein